MGDLFVFGEIAGVVERAYRMVVMPHTNSFSFGGIQGIEKKCRHEKLGSEPSFVVITRLGESELACEVFIRDGHGLCEKLVRTFKIDHPNVSTYVPEVKIWLTSTGYGQLASWITGESLRLIF